MAEINYIGFGELITSLKKTLSHNPSIIFREIPQLGLDSSNCNTITGEVFLIGPYSFDVLAQVQRAYLQNKVISMVVQLFPATFQKIKQKIQFSYNVGKNITYVSYEMGKNLAELLDHAVLKTRQRMSFLRIQNAQPVRRSIGQLRNMDSLNEVFENIPLALIAFNEFNQVVAFNAKAKEHFPRLSERLSDQNWSGLFLQAEPDLQAWSQLAGESHFYKKCIKSENRYSTCISLSLVMQPKISNTFYSLKKQRSK